MAAKKTKSKPSAPKAKTKSVAKKAPKAAKKPVAKKEVTKKSVAPAKKKVAPAKKSAASKPTAKKAAAKPTAKKTAAKPATKKAAAKPTAKKATAKPAAAKPAAEKAVKKAPTSVTKKAAAPVAKKLVKKAEPKPKAAKPVRKVVKSSHTPAFIKKQHQRLLDLHDELLDAMSGMTRDTIRNAPEGSEASGSGQHQGDAGSDAYDRDFALSVLAKEQDALYEIEQALQRVQAGTYGVCEMSMNKIPQMRLEAIPFARLTVECQSEWEREYGNRRFRPSNEVGFSGGNHFDDEDSDTVSLDDED